MTLTLSYLTQNGFKIAIACAVSAVILLVASLVRGYTLRNDKIFKKNKLIKQFFVNMAYAFIIVTTAIYLLSHLGVPISSLIAVLGAGSLAIGLALKDSLANVASGIVMIVERPFAIGDNVIVCSSIEGTVQNINLYTTTIKLYTGEIVVIPHAKVIGNEITNLSKSPVRRLDIKFYVEYQSNIDLIKTLISNEVAISQYVNMSPAAKIIISALDTNGVLMTLQAWVNKENYGNAKAELLESLKSILENNNIKFSVNVQPTAVA